MYRTQNYRSVPSGGALYPLILYVCLFEKIDDWDIGWYFYDSDNNLLIKTGVAVDIDKISWILDSVSILDNAQFLVAISADLEKTTAKYSNRGYRLALLEAGHCAQNAYLYCAETDFGTVEWGGYKDEELAKMLSLKYPNEAIVNLMIAGLPAVGKYYDTEITKSSYILKEMLIGENKPVEFLQSGILSNGDYTLPLTVAKARYRPYSEFATEIYKERAMAYGKGRSMSLAIVTALAEAYERYCSGAIRVDKLASGNELKDLVFDLLAYFPYSNDQYVMKGLKKRDEFDQWEWITGRYLVTNSKCYVPIDQVFYPIYQQDINRPLCYSANSSGVSAHFDKDKATLNALMELIERDAFAVTWYTKREVYSLSQDMIPISIKNRLNYWSNQGRVVKILDITLDSVPVVLVLIVGKESPCLIAGLSANPSFKKAITSAFDEAEVMLLSWMNASIIDLDPKDVISVRDHGMLYFGDKYVHEVDWLIKSKEKRPLINGAVTVLDVIKQFDPVLIDMTPKESVGLHVVRVMSRKLMPLTFGWGMEHYIDNSRIEMLNLTWNEESPSFPHFFS
jgi:thiazole/oxazole-forming peptide maturase SagD family component